MEKIYLFSADAILATHFAFVTFVLAGMVVIWLGYFFRWRFVRNFYFRVTHLLCIGFVIVLTLLGKDCPLTIWENNLRIMVGTAALYERGCIPYWMDRLLFYDVEQQWILNAAYYAFFGLVVLSLIFVKPRLPKKSRSRGNETLEPFS